MRIGGGRANRRTLQTLAGHRVRPTSGRVRQALCNILQWQMPGAVFVDLFAGTGSVGLEALSHGVRHAYFIECDPRVLRVLETNIARCALPGQATVIHGVLPSALTLLPTELQADMLFLDPPYASNLAELTLTALAGSRLLAPHGVVVWQHAVRHLAPSMVLGLSLWQRRRYGDTLLSLYASSHRLESDPGTSSFPASAEGIMSG